MCSGIRRMISPVERNFLLLICLLITGKVDPFSRSPVQYHIQTDIGPERYFRYQTLDGQYRKEKRYEDGTVIGTYGWVDPTGILRLYDYLADREGYRIVRTRTEQVDVPQPHINAIPDTVRKPSYKQEGPKKVPSYKQERPKKIPSNKIYRTQQGPSQSAHNIIPTPSNVHWVSQTHPPLTTTQMPTTKVLEEIKPTPKPQLRPLFKKRRNKPLSSGRKPQNDFHDSRRESFSTARERLKFKTNEIQSKHINKLNSPHQESSIVRENVIPSNEVALPSRTFIPKDRRTKQSLPLVNNPTLLSSDSEVIPDFGYDEPGGKVTIDFDIGNQYRKEKVFPDGTVVGEHGYVDPMGILRVTYYRSGGSGQAGQREIRRSYRVGTRLPKST